jgi:hypothetical protein
MTEFEQKMLDLVGEMKSDIAELKAQNNTLTQGINAIAKDAQQKNEAYKAEIVKRDEEFAKVYKYLTQNLSYKNLCDSSRFGVQNIITKEDVSDIWTNFQTIMNMVGRVETDIEKRLHGISRDIALIRR